MGFLGLLHHHPRHRARQLRWVVPLAALLLVAVLATLAVQYEVSNREIGAEFFRAHKTISHTGELLRRGTGVAGGAAPVPGAGGQGGGAPRPARPRAAGAPPGP